MFLTIKKLFFVSRPISWPNTAYPFAAAYLLSGGAVDPLLIIGTLFFLIPYNLLMYGVNDVFDYESDIRNPRKGGIEGMREQKAFHPTIMIASIGLTIPFGIYLLVSSNLAGALVFIALLLFVIGYSIKGLRLKERPVLDSITSSIHFVGPALYAIAINGLTPAMMPYLVAFFLWGVSSHALGAIQDIIPDRKGKLHSIATALGAKVTLRLVAALYAVASVALLDQGAIGIILAAVNLIYLLNVLPYWNISDKTSGQSNRAWRRFIWLNYFTGFVVTLVIISLFL